MAVRKLFIVLAVLAGLFAFHGNIAAPAPREKARTEIIVGNRQQQEVRYDHNKNADQVTVVFKESAISKAQVPNHLARAPIISHQHHHSTL